MTRFSRGLGSVGRRRWFGALGSRVAAPIDRALFRLSPRWLDAPLRRDLPTLMITTRGKKSGRPAMAPLLYLEAGAGWAVVATNWGRPSHPAWSANLLADPRASVAFGDHGVEVVARRVSGAEFDALWARFVEMWPAFEEYRRSAGRRLRMFVLEPASP